jgi:hypothetical protein
MPCFTTRSASARSKSNLIGNTLPQDARVRVYIELDWVRLLPFVTVRSFLVDIATHVSEYRSGTVDYVQANQEIDRAMSSVLWKALKAPQYSVENEPSYDAQIEVKLTGSASFYLERREYVRDQRPKAADTEGLNLGLNLT